MKRISLTARGEMDNTACEPWSIFPVGLLRSAGFPFEWIDGLASPHLLELAENAMRVRGYLDGMRHETLVLLRRIQASQVAGTRMSINNIIKKVAKYTAITDTSREPSIIGPWNEAVHAYGDALTRLELALTKAYADELATLTSHAGMDEFRDAVLLGSRTAYAGLSGTKAGEPLRTREAMLAYRFLQRFCTKNDTTGHVGPLNLITFGECRPTCECPEDAAEHHYYDALLGVIAYRETGDGRSAHRKAFISYWAATELGNRLIKACGQPSHLVYPRRNIAARLEYLSATERQVVRHSDGRTHARRIAERMGVSPDEIVRHLESLTQAGVVNTDWHIEEYATDPGVALRALCAQVEENPSDHMSARISKILDSIELFAKADYHARPVLLSEITSDFQSLTSSSSWRGHGLVQADRTILHEDAIGNITRAHVGAIGAGRFARQLSPVMDLLASIAIDERAAGQAALARFMSAHGVAELPALEVMRMPGDPPSADATRPTIACRLARLIDPTLAHAKIDADQLHAEGLIRQDLDAWPLFGAADIMLSGMDTAGGPGKLILSELHHIWPQLACQVRALYDDNVLWNDRLWNLLAAELAPAEPTLQQIVRHNKATDSSPFGHTLLCVETESPAADAVAVPIDRVVVRTWANGFIGLHDPARKRDMWLLPEYEDSGIDIGGLANCAIPALSLPVVSLGRCTPRIVINDVVIQRRRWEFESSEIPDMTGSLPSAAEWQRFHEWRTAADISRRVYFMPRGEAKPMYADFASVLSVANFLRSARRSASVVVSEALPNPEHLWLRTGTGALTSEIRILLHRDRRVGST